MLDFGKRAGKTFMEVYFCDPGYYSWALSQQPKVDTLKDFKYFLRRAGDIECKDKKKRERERDWVTRKLRKYIQDRASKCAEELAQEEVRVAEETGTRKGGQEGGCPGRRRRSGKAWRKSSKRGWRRKEEEDGLDGAAGGRQSQGHWSRRRKQGTWRPEERMRSDGRKGRR